MHACVHSMRSSAALPQSYAKHAQPQLQILAAAMRAARALWTIQPMQPTPSPAYNRNHRPGKDNNIAPDGKMIYSACSAAALQNYSRCTQDIMPSQSGMVAAPEYAGTAS
jgi:hypothetical protein